MNNKAKAVIESIKKRALNDYSADKVTHNKTNRDRFPKKVAMCIDSCYPGMKVCTGCIWRDKTSS